MCSSSRPVPNTLAWSTHHQHAARKRGVKGLQVEAQLIEQGPQHRLCICMLVWACSVSGGAVEGPKPSRPSDAQAAAEPTCSPTAHVQQLKLTPAVSRDLAQIVIEAPQRRDTRAIVQVRLAWQRSTGGEPLRSSDSRDAHPRLPTLHSTYNAHPILPRVT